VSAAAKPPEDPPLGGSWHHPARVGFEALVRLGPVMVAVNSAFPGVAPDHVRAAGEAIPLRLGFGLTPPIPDLGWNDAEVHATLAFGGKLFNCRIPWCAVLAVKLDGAPAPTPARSRPTHLKLVE
jgi:hypothetical protein